MKTIAALAFALLLCGFSMEDAENKVIRGHEARLAIEAYGFTDVKIVGPALWGCGNDYTLVDEFTGIGPTGYKVKGMICGSIVLKGWTIKIWEAEPPSPKASGQ